MKPSPKEAAATLEGVGFTALEARIYVELLHSGPLSGYRIAQKTGKATANTYKALDGLSQRGIVYCEDGATRLYRAVPYAEVAATLAGDFQRRLQRSTNAVAALDRATSDDRIYRLEGAEQIYERAHALILRARSVVLIDAFPEAVERLRPALETAAANGVAVTVHVYGPVQIPHSRIVEAPHASATRSQWPGVWVNVSADGSSALIAYVFDDARTVGFWTENPHVAWIFHCGIASETALARLSQLAATDPRLSLDEALRDVREILAADVPGRVTLSSHDSKRKGRLE